MLKHSSPKLQLAILKLFNVVLECGFFPVIWNRGLINPIYKNGDKFDPNNYRGICVNSNLGKVFCSILNTRGRFFKTFNPDSILPDNQIPPFPIKDQNELTGFVHVF